MSFFSITALPPIILPAKKKKNSPVPGYLLVTLKTTHSRQYFLVICMNANFVGSPVQFMMRCAFFEYFVFLLNKNVSHI